VQLMIVPAGLPKPHNVVMSVTPIMILLPATKFWPFSVRCVPAASICAPKITTFAAEAGAAAVESNKTDQMIANGICAGFIVASEFPDALPPAKGYK
jgi:hypothetical protein